MEIRYSRDALRFLSKLDKKTVKRIRDGISNLTLSPPQGDIAIMQGYSDGRKRLRIGAFRVIFRYEEKQCVEILFIIDIGNRGDIYK